MSDFVIMLLEAPLRPPGYDVQIGAHWVELLGLTLVLPALIFLAFLGIGMGPSWLKTARGDKGEVEASQ